MSAQELPEAHVIVGAGTGIALETGGLDQQGPRLALSGEGLLGRFAYMVATEAVTVLLGTLYWSLSARLVPAHAGARGGPGGGRLLRARGPRGGARRHPRGSALLLPMFLSKSLFVESVGDAGVLRRSIRVTFPVGLLTCLAVIAGLEEGGSSHLVGLRRPLRGGRADAPSAPRARGARRPVRRVGGRHHRRGRPVPARGAPGAAPPEGPSAPASPGPAGGRGSNA